ncbi:MAG TPA: helix-turn-helix domain-containing protein [Jatrophihabitans sp.]|jgi:hypothetical protein|nr:helix-turn-helix domain-containing protein [Jatrophihabitans sp.]
MIRTPTASINRPPTSNCPTHNLPSAVNDICTGCVADLDRQLRRLPDLYRRCEDALTSDHPHAPRERTSGGGLPGLPFNTDAADARSSIVSILASWSSLVADGRPAARPARSVPRLAAFLLRHLDWLAAHPSAADACAEIRELVRTASRAVEPNHRRVPVGSCGQRDCGGRLLARLPESGRRELAIEVICTEQPEHRHRLTDWDEARPPATAAGASTDGPWLSATEVATLSRIATGSVYRLASEHRWQRCRIGGRTHYRGTDVTATLRQAHSPAGPPSSTA